MYVCTQDMHTYVHTFCMYICCVVVYMCVPHLLHSRGSSEEQVPLSIRDLPSLPQDVGTEHEGEDQFVLLKEPPVDVCVCGGGEERGWVKYVAEPVLRLLGTGPASNIYVYTCT